MSDLISRREMLRTYQELCMNIACSECSFYFGDTLTGDCLLEKWIHSLPSTEKAQLSEEDATKDATSDLISRQDAIDAVEFGITYAKAINKSTGEVKELFKEGNKALNEAVERLKELPSAEPERDIPIKPIETTDRAWGIPNKQAVCPKCDYYLGHVAFLGDYKGKRMTYCETCGQAIDWEGWDFDE